MSRLPVPGSDNGNWGTILNDYLLQSHKPDGALRDNSVTSSMLTSGAVQASNLLNTASATNGQVLTLDSNSPGGYKWAAIPTAQVNPDWNSISGASQILNKPTLHAVAISGSYADLTGKPTIPAAQIQSDWSQTSNTQADYIKNKPSLHAVATSGSYTDLTNKPTIPAAQVNADWNATSGVAQILNKPTLGTAASANTTAFATAAQGTKADSAVQPGSLATVATSGSYGDLTGRPTLATIATSGSYTDLTNKPTIPAAQVQADWNQTNNTQADYIKNKPTLNTPINPRDYGAVADGVANDTTAFSAAMQAAQAQKRPVVIDGTILVTTSVTVPTGVNVYGAHTTASIKTASNITVLQLGDDAHVSHLTIDGGGASSYLVAVSGNRARIDSCKLVNSPGYGIHTFGATDCSVQNCHFENITSYALLSETGGGRIQFKGCHIIHATSGQGVTIKQGPKNIVIANNTVDIKGTVGLEVQISPSGDCAITGNVVKGPSIGISLSGASGFSVAGNTVLDCATYGIEAAEAASNGTISGNTILRCGTGVIVSTSGQASKNVTAIGNTIKAPTVYGINYEAGSGHTITGNSIEDSGDRSIFCNNGVSNILISSNHIVRTSANTPVNAEGIYVSGNNSTILANDIDYEGLVNPSGYAIFSNGPSQISIIANIVHGKTLKAIALVGGTSHYITANRTSDHTQHSIYLSNVTTVVIDAHAFKVNGGGGIETAGATNPIIGSVYNASSNLLTNGLNALTKGLTLQNQTTATTAPSAGAAQALPATPAGYLTVSINGTNRSIPYY